MERGLKRHTSGPFIKRQIPDLELCNYVIQTPKMQLINLSINMYHAVSSFEQISHRHIHSNFSSNDLSTNS